MFIQTEITPNPNSLKFLPGKKVSNIGVIEITKKDESNNQLVKEILSVNGVEGILLASDFISVNKLEKISSDEIKHIIISLINNRSCVNQIYIPQTFSGRFCFGVHSDCVFCRLFSFSRFHFVYLRQIVISQMNVLGSISFQNHQIEV